MKGKWPAFSVVTIGGLLAVAALQAPSASGGDPGARESSPDRGESLHAAYAAHLATNDAAAERWRAAHGEGRPVDPGADEPSPDSHGCPEGTQYWRRDRITELCAPLCTGDQDCGPEDGRCRLLDVEERDDAAPIVLVDDTPAEELEAVELDETKQAPPIRVCDPFWDVEGALDADLVESSAFTESAP